MNSKIPAAPLFRRKVIAASILLAISAAHAEQASDPADAIRQDLARPSSWIGIGIGHLDGQARQFGLYNGLNHEGTYGLLNFNLVNRDEATGTWTKLKGRDLGLDSRDLRFDQERQGDWSYFVEGSQLSRKDSKTVNTGLQGIGTDTQVISANPPKRNLDFSINHDTVAFGMRKYFVGDWNVRTSFRQDEKEGNRIFSHYQVFETGLSGRRAVFFLAEPIDRTTRQWDLVASYADRKLQLSGGYAGSAFVDHTSRIDFSFDPANTTFNPADGVLAQSNRIGLPQSNHSHQIFLSGGYNFSDVTRSSFKVSRSLALQDSTFSIPAGPSPTSEPSRQSLGGKVVTTLLFADLTTRPSDRLDLTANVRYEDRDDRTPTAQYLTAQAPVGNTGVNGETLLTPYLYAGYTGFNVPRSQTQWKETVEAGYRIDSGYRLVGTLEREDMKQTVPSQYRRVAHRENLDETTGRIELKAALSETLNGALAYSYSDRGGSDYVPDTYVAEAITNQINPLHFADRKRQKLRLTTDWTPDDQWSMQLMADASDDRYSGRNLGPRKGNASFVGVDTTYALSDKWKLTGWVSQERTFAEQSTRTANAPIVAFLGPFPGDVTANGDPKFDVIWQARLRNVTTAWGLTMKGKPKPNLELSADLSSSTDVATHTMSPVTSLPEFYYRQLSLKLSANYSLERNSGLRGDFVFDRRRNDDWTWQNWAYGETRSGQLQTDGTTVSQPTHEVVRFVGLTYYYRWR